VTAVYDPPQGQVATVERLLQVLALLRQSEIGVPRTVLLSQVQGYADKIAEGVKHESVLKTMQLDVKALGDLGFVIEDIAAEGQESVFLLRPTSWRVPIDLTDVDKGLLAWVLRAVEVSGDDPAGVTTAPDAFDALLGSVPRTIGEVQAALAGRRALVIEKNGEDQVIEPAQLVMHARRWILLARYPGNDKVYGHRLDGLHEVRLGEPLSAPPGPVEPLEVLDPTYWLEDDTTLDVELRCARDDLALVGSWFPRALVTDEGADAVLRFPVRNLDALLDRVLGLAGAVRVTAPAEAVQAMRERLEPFVVAS
jgi:hypothetical protein